MTSCWIRLDMLLSLSSRCSCAPDASDFRSSSVSFQKCASPGGKTTHLASQLLGRGVVIALDRTQAKIERIQQTSTTCGLANMIRWLVLDATKAVAAEEDGALGKSDLAEIVNGTKIKGFQAGIFDRVLVDPPCSGFGP